MCTRSPSTQFTIVSFRMWHSRSVVDIVNISNKRLFTREILNTEIGSALKSGSATPRVAARPQLKHSVGAQHSTLSRAPTCCFLFYSKYLLFDRTPSVLLEDGTWLSCCGNLYSGSKNGIIKPGQGILKPTTFLFHSSLSLRRKKLLI